MQQNLCYNCFKEKRTNEETCPHCGYNPENNREKYPLALPCGTPVGGKYIIGRVLGQGGFGITYVAQDYKNKQLVAIKEYFPDFLATRTEQRTVSSYAGEREENFLYGKQCFLDEAKTLAEFIGNSNIVRVYSYFEENNTAYFAMEYIEGTSFKDYISDHGGKITWEDAKRILLPVMDALSEVHAKGIIHRDISPDNIFITKDGTVKLLDFGAARYSMGDKSRSLDVVLKHGYAPKEQYARHGRQGPFTDIYALAATFYRAISGRVPPDSIDRIDEDDLVLPSTLGSDIPQSAEEALIKALSVQSNDRFQSMQSFKQAIENTDVNFNPIPLPASQTPSTPQTPSTSQTSSVPIEATPVKHKAKWKIPVIISSACVFFVVLVITISIMYLSNKGNSDYKYKVTNGEVIIEEYINEIQTNVQIPSEIDGKPVTKIGEYAFSKRSGLTKVIIPVSVTEIKDGAFSECIGITDIDIPNSVTAIGKDSFYGCSNLEKVTIPDSVTVIGERAFSFCSSLESITIPDSVTAIGKNSFYNCSSLKEVTIPDGVTAIGEYAFSYCDSLKKVSIPKNCNVSSNAFDDDIEIEKRK